LSGTITWAVGRRFADSSCSRPRCGAPLFTGGTLKIASGLLLYRAFRHVRPPEEQARRGSPV
jgi:hypothetical protein